eukprot:scaffold15712_cov84-Isochrysis_galbana.AAC.3
MRTTRPAAGPASAHSTGRAEHRALRRPPPAPSRAASHAARRAHAAAPMDGGRVSGPARPRPCSISARRATGHDA